MLSASPTTAPPTVPVTLPVSHLSVSSLQRFWRCPEQWMRHYLLGEREPTNGAMALGTAVGQAVAHHFSARLAGAPIAKTEARESFHHAFDQAGAEAIFDGATDAERRTQAADLRSRGERVLATYLDSSLVAELEREQVIAVEPRHELRFPGAEWSFLAYLDLVTAAGTIVDVKVKAKHLGEGEARRDPQARGYVLARSLANGNRQRPRFVFHCLRHGANPEARAVPAHGLSLSGAELAAFQQRLILTARKIAECHRTGDWGYASPQGWWCSERCAFWGDCPGGARA